MNESVSQVSDASFDEDVLKQSLPVVVDYWAEWCGPCKAMSPAFDQAAQEFAGRVKFVKLNIEDNQVTPPKYGIRGIPTLMIFRNGAVEATHVGSLSKAQLSAFLDANI